MKSSKAKVSYAPGTYRQCQACGHILNIQWPTRRILCSCGNEISTVDVSAGAKD